MLLALVATALIQGSAVAHLVPLSSRVIESPSQEYILVLLNPEPLLPYDPAVDGEAADADVKRWNEKAAREQALAARYSCSGLYRNDGSATLLWPYTYNSYANDYLVAHDGVHLVVAYLDWPNSVSNRGPALQFLARGKVIAAYGEDELVDWFWFRLFMARRFDWPVPEGRDVTLDDEGKLLRLTTNYGEVLEFDVATGRELTGWSPWTLVWALLVGVAMALFINRRRRRRA